MNILKFISVCAVETTHVYHSKFNDSRFNLPILDNKQ